MMKKKGFTTIKELNKIRLTLAKRGLRRRPISPTFYKIKNLAYVAGKYEGEGWFSWMADIRRPPLQRLVIDIGTADRQIWKIARLWNVSVYEEPPYPSARRLVSFYRALATGLRAYCIIEAITPFLTPNSPRRDQAEWILAWFYDHS
ncbi:MAG: hypothetical protein ACUVTD_03370 [Nitrososphaerales archaeon]